MAGLLKLALDFLLRPATMTSRQHTGTKLYNIRRGKLARRRQPFAAGEGTCMAVWFMCWLRCADTIQTADGTAITIGNDVTPTNDRRDNALHTRERAHALNHGGAIG